MTFPEARRYHVRVWDSARCMFLGGASMNGAASGFGAPAGACCERLLATEAFRPPCLRRCETLRKLVWEACQSTCILCFRSHLALQNKAARNELRLPTFLQVRVPGPPGRASPGSRQNGVGDLIRYLTLCSEWTRDLIGFSLLRRMGPHGLSQVMSPTLAPVLGSLRSEI